MRLEAYTADSVVAERVASRATREYGGATIVEGTGITDEWGRETVYIVTVFTDKDFRGLQGQWEGIVRHAMLGHNEDSVLVAFDNDHLFVERTS